MTKPRLAQMMLERALDAGVKPAWVTGDRLVQRLNPAERSREQAASVRLGGDVSRLVTFCRRGRLAAGART